MKHAYHEQLEKQIAFEKRRATTAENWAERIWRDGRASALSEVLAKDKEKVATAQRRARESLYGSEEVAA